MPLFCRKALKAIYVEDSSPNESIDAEHEVAILVRLRHPNIVRFHDSFIDASYFCIVTEYCEVNFRRHLFFFPDISLFS